MRTMIMDTSSHMLIVSFVDENKIIYQKMLSGKNNHSDNLLKTISEGLSEVSLEVKDFSNIIVGIGPGAYTGLRVSLTVAKMFAWTLKLKLYTISSLDLVATDINEDGIYAINMHAKRDYVYHKIVEVKNNHLTSLTEEKFLNINDANKINSEYNVKSIINNDNIKYNPLNISQDHLTLIDELFLLEPNYLRDAE